MSCGKILKDMKLGNEILLQYYDEQVIRVKDRAKKLLVPEVITKLASSSVGERIFKEGGVHTAYSLKLGVILK